MNSTFSDQLVALFKEQRFQTSKATASKRERIKLEAGKSVSEADVAQIEAKSLKRKAPGTKTSPAPKKKLIPTLTMTYFKHK